MSRWITEDFNTRPWRLPAEPAVYAFLIGGITVYVGQTTNLKLRVSAHSLRYGYASNIITPWERVSDKTPVRLKYSLSKKYGDWAMRELRLIKRLCPKWNVTGTGRPRINAKQAA